MLQKSWATHFADKIIPNRELDLGQYIFIRAKKVRNIECVEAPEWLYRSMSDTKIQVGDELVTNK